VGSAWGAMEKRFSNASAMTVERYTALRTNA